MATKSTTTTTTDKPATLTAAQVNAALKRLTAFASAKPAQDIVSLYAGKAWTVTGHKDWAAFCAERMAGLKYTTVTRRTMLPELIEAGLSQRAIAVAVNVKQPQIAQDLAAIRALDNPQPAEGEGAEGAEGEGAEGTEKAPKTPEQKAAEKLAAAIKAIAALGDHVPDEIKEAVHKLEALVDGRAEEAVTEAPAKPAKPAKSTARKSAAPVAPVATDPSLPGIDLTPKKAGTVRRGNAWDRKAA